MSLRKYSKGEVIRDPEEEEIRKESARTWSPKDEEDLEQENRR